MSVKKIKHLYSRLLNYCKRKGFHILGLQFRNNYHLDNPVSIPERIERLGIHSKAVTHIRKSIIDPETEVIYSFPNRYIYKINEPIISITDNLIFRKDGKLIAESSSWPIYRLLWENPTPFKTCYHAKIKGVLIYLPITRNYYHWLLEDLPVFLSVIKFNPTATILIPSTNFKPAKDFINYFLKTNDKIYIDSDTKVESLIVAGKTAGLGSPFGHNVLHPSDIKILKNWFFERELPKTNKYTEVKKVYISRVGHRRSPSGEKLLVERLQSKDYFIFDGNLGLFEQIELFSSAKLIVGASGAGLVNMLWMSPGATCIKLDLGSEKFHFFVDLAAYCNLNYYGISVSDTSWLDDDLNHILDCIASIENEAFA